ncbi:HypC/HybG/HupF family hydrogenase formation chaperone [Halomonas faecis]|uniref:HypC/HybG/HupF family hydrogenase formation chaperone n=1 Tax=Halomonas faecis TaxID=1562110 RepID=UPI0013D4EC39|nr:HypC/HybG/HupF family hydrogenase formation chaperone [Halomonas faecis]
MCLAVPVKVVECLDDGQALIDAGGVSKAIDVSLLETVAPGDYVIVHVGFAINRLDTEEAERTLAMIRELGLELGEST